jgi:hypothetical protein
VGEADAGPRGRRRVAGGLSWLFVLRSELSGVAVFAQGGWHAYRYDELSADVLGLGRQGVWVGSAGVQALPESHAGSPNSPST